MATKVCQKLLYCDSTLEVNLLVCNVIEREIEREKVQMKLPIDFAKTHSFCSLETL